MTETSVQTKVRQVWFTSVIAIVSIAVLGLILEIALGSKPEELINKLTRARDGSEQVRLELTLLGKLLADDPDSYPADLVRQLAGMKLSLEAGLKKLRESGLKPDNEKAFQQLEMIFQERFLPEFINFRQPYGDQDLPKIRARLRETRNELESRLGLFERSLIQYSTKNLKDTLQIKFMAAAGGCVLGVLGLALLWFQVQGLQKDISKAIQEAAPVSGADAKMAENIAKYAGRIRELEGSNKLLRSEVDKLAPLADEVVTLRQQVSASPWETWLKAIHGRGRSTLGKGGQLGIVLEVLPDEIQSLEPLLREHTEFIRIEAPSDTQVPAQSQHTVLVVDEDFGNRARLLSCISGLDLDVLEAASTQEAWQIIDAGVVVRLCLVGVRDGETAGADFGKRVKSDPRFPEVEIILCTALMSTEELTRTLEKVAASKTPLEEAQEQSGLNSHAYGKMLQAVNTETKETLTFARTALSHGQRKAAWNRITSLKETANSVGDKVFNNAIASVEKEMDRGDVFFITAELERLERENQRLSKLAEKLLTSAPKAIDPEKINQGESQ
jgi:CheY-like chemotaxis protein